MKVKNIKNETIWDTYKLIDLRGHENKNSYMGNYSKQTYHENVQANRQKSLDYENEQEGKP